MAEVASLSRRRFLIDGSWSRWYDDGDDWRSIVQAAYSRVQAMETCDQAGSDHMSIWYGTNQQTNDHENMALRRDELLVLLIEECGEVIQAATKCLRFGWDRDQPGYGVNNEVLADEVGDLSGVVAELNLDRYRIATRAGAKIAKATRIKAMITSENAPQPLAAYQ